MSATARVQNCMTVHHLFCDDTVMGVSPVPDVKTSDTLATLHLVNTLCTNATYDEEDRNKPAKVYLVLSNTPSSQFLVLYPTSADSALYSLSV